MLGATSARGVAATNKRLSLAERGLRQAQKSGMRALLLQGERIAKKDLLTGNKGSHGLMGVTGAKQGLGVRSGATRASVNTRIWAIGGQTIGAIGSTSRIIAMHERQRIVITPKKSKYLRIPTKFSQTKAGVDRLAGTPLRGSLDGTFVARSRNNNLFVFQKVGAKIIPRYLLVERVTIKGRKIWTQLEKKMRALTPKLLGSKVRGVVLRANR